MSAFEFEQDFADKLAERTGIAFNASDVDDWFEGGDEFDHVDLAVRKLLGDKLYDEAEQAARMIDVTWAVLCGRKSVTAGGVRFTQLDKR